MLVRPRSARQIRGAFARRSTPDPGRAPRHCVRSALQIFIALAATSVAIRAQNVNVGVGTNAPDLSALLELRSLAKGLLIPRETDAQMRAIVTPAKGDLVFNTSTSNFYFFNGYAWNPIVGSGWSLTGDAGTNPSQNFLGTKDAVDLVEKTNFRERMRFFAGGNVGLTSNYNVAEKLLFFEPSSVGGAYTSFQARAQSTSPSYRLPLGDGSDGSALVTDGAGNLTWKFFATIGGGGSDPVWKRGSGQRTLEGLGSGNHASGKYSMAEGFSNQATGQYSMVFGDNNQGSGQEAIVTGGQSNQATGDHATVAGGSSNHSSGNHTYIGGGQNNSNSGTHGVVVGGNTNAVSGTESIIIDGQNNSASGNDNLIFGANVTIAGSNTIIFAPPGPTQTRLGILTGAPTEAADIRGNVRFSGAIKPNGSGGASGQYLLSAGAGAPPTWGTITVPTTNWQLTGNAGTSPLTNFIGTTDAQDFVLRTAGTERMRILSTGQIGIGTSAPRHPLTIVSANTGDETASAFGSATGTTSVQSLGLWATASAANSNTGSIALLATGNGNQAAHFTNAALQINSGEFAMGRTTQLPAKGTNVDGAAAGTAYSAQGPSGVIEFSMQADLTAVPPVAGQFQDLGTVTINNRYATPQSIILTNVVNKTNGGGSPDPKNSVYKVDIESRATGAFTIRIGMIPTVTDPNSYQGSDYIRVAYVIINPGR